MTGLTMAWLVFCALNIVFWTVIAGGNPLPYFRLPAATLATVVAVVALLAAFLAARGAPKPTRIAVLGAVTLPVPLAWTLYTFYWLAQA